jgi:RNA polymerase sigma-70 factor (ECF subfamily)
MDPISIIQRVLASEHEAFAELMEPYELTLRAYIAGKLLHATDVDDVYQETLLAAYQHLERFDQERDFLAWLRGVARFKVMNHMRGAGRRQGALQRFREQVDVLIHDAYEAAFDDGADSITALRSCIGKLPERSRRVVESGLEGNKAECLAAEYSTTLPAIYNLQYRANKTLRRCVRQELHHG